MNFKKIIALISAAAISAGILVAPTMAEDTVFSYDFTAFSSANGYAKDSLNTTLAGYEGLTGVINELASDSKAYIKLSGGDTTSSYIDFNATSTFTLSFTSSHSNMSKGTLVTNTTTGEMYTTSSKEQALVIPNLPAGSYRVSGTPAGDYYDVLKGTTTSISKNHAYISTMTITYGEYVAPTTAPTADPNATPAPTPTPGPTTDPSIPSALTIIDYEPWLESAYVAWTNTREVDKYNVYVKKAADTEYTKIDDELVRRYDTYYRADALGLAEGEYTMKVAAVIAGVESDIKETGVMQVKAHNRDGFAHDPKSPNGTASGGYNDDGTPKSDAIILYVDKTNVNTITADVIIDGKGKIETKVGLAEIMAGRQKGYDKTPLIIRYIGHIPASAVADLNSAGYIQVKGCYNVTMEGVGEDTILEGWSFLMREANNVEIRNFGIKSFKDDGLSLDTDNTNVWVHNNDIFYGNNKGGDQEKGDGSCDVKGNSTYVTISYNHFWDSGKCSLCGMHQDSVDFYVTYHHNWFDHSDSRHPRIRKGSIHIYNNYFDGNAKYGVGVTTGSSAFVEANYFRNCLHPMLSSLQGTDALVDGTFSGETGGIIKAYNNAIYGGNPIINAKDNATTFDAYFADTRDEQVPSTYKTLSGGTTYNNFDTAAAMYEYTPDVPANVPAVVEKYSGRCGNDFEFEFNDEVDDAIYDINTELESKVKAYTSEVKATYVSGGTYPATAPGATVAPEKTAEPTLDPNATIAPTAEPTPTPIPTNTPEPTPTPTPSPTPDPNATPAPTLAPSSTVTVVGEGIKWIANDFTTGTYSATIFHNGLDVGATAESGVEVTENKTTIGTTAYTKRIKIGGKGNTVTGARCLIFTPDVDCDLVIDCASSNKDTAREVIVEQHSAKQTVSVLSGMSYTITGLKANEPVYIYSLSGGWYVYGLALTPKAEPEVVKIEATYDENGRLSGVVTSKIKQSEAGDTVNNGTAKVFYWNSISSMQPIK